MPDASDADPAAANDLAFPALDSTQSRLIADAVARAARQGRQAIPKTAKNTFSLADYQTPFRNQGERSTSWAFAGAAALEAAYKRRYGISLSLSAEYVFHIGRAFELFSHPADAPRSDAFLSHFPGCGAVAQLLAQCAVVVDEPDARALGCPRTKDRKAGMLPSRRVCGPGRCR